MALGQQAEDPAEEEAAALPPLSKFATILKFRRQIPCSPDVIGRALGDDGSPQRRKCKQGGHYHGECPKE